MAADLYRESEVARKRFAQAAEVLGFDIQAIMAEGSEEDLMRTAVTQPAIFLHSVLLSEALGLDRQAGMAAGHSLGEFSALVAAGSMGFEEGLQLVQTRAQAMQAACDLTPSTMAAIVGLEDAAVEAICREVPGVVPANYNAPGQLVVSGSTEGISNVVEKAKAHGAKLAKVLQVGGAFHSPLMAPAQEKLAQGIARAVLIPPRFPIYQNVDGKPQTDPEIIRENLNRQLTAAVRWTDTIENMLAAGAAEFVEVGPGKVLQGLVKRIRREAATRGIQALADAQ